MATTTLPVRGHTLGPRRAARTAPVPLWSVTKVVIATQVLRLADEGRLRLDGPLTEHEPWLPGADLMTVGHLLTHRSGLPDYGALPAYRQAVASTPDRPWDDDRFLTLLADGPVRAPGTAFGYSNLGYLLLRRIVEAATGLPWHVAVARDVLAPAGLDGVVPVVDLDDVARLRADARPLGGAYHPGWVAHGLLAADLEDLARLVATCLLGPGELARRRASLLPVPVPARPYLPGTPAYGYGVMGPVGRAGTPAGALTVLGHGGGGPGSATAAYVAVDADGDGVVVGAQASGAEADTLDEQVAAALFAART